jgi:uncharacterized membrane protein
MKTKTLYLTYAAAIAALYVGLTVVSNAMGLASGPIQVRLSEALTVLPAFTPAAVPGLFIGCLLANLVTGCAPWDVVFGSLATLIGAIGTYKFGKNRYLAPLFPIAANTLIVPFILRYVYAAPGSIPYFMATVGLGELVACGVLGILLYEAVKRTNLFSKLGGRGE